MVYRLGLRMRKARTLKPGHSLLITGLVLAVIGTSAASAQRWASDRINIWWPVADAQLSGIQPIKGDLVNQSVNKYNMYWSVDDGQRNNMPTNYEHYPHKEATIDVSSWTWRGNGPYKLTYYATTTDGRDIAQRSIQVYVTPSTASATAVTAEPMMTSEASNTVTAPTGASTTTTATPTTPTKSAIARLYVAADNNPLRQAAEWKTSRPTDAALMERMGAQSQAKWFGGWNTSVETEVHALVEAAKAKNTVPVLVAYNIPQRDCGLYSAGGSASGQAYREWINAFARGIGAAPAIVVLEPDALAGTDCLNATDKTNRLQLISEAVTTLKKQSGTKVYIDAGNPRWHSTNTMSTLLASANVKSADGFSLNVSNFFTTEENIKYGDELSGKAQGKHYVIDTSRNGAGPTADQQWCNPEGRALGALPTTATNKPLVDAYLWIKTPGESDGNCNGAPSAGQWMPEYALGLAKRVSW